MSTLPAEPDPVPISQVRVHLTDAAVAAMQEMVADADVGEAGGVRLTARTGAGCSAPMQFGMFLEEAPEDDDAVLEASGLRLFLAPEDAWSLDGLQIHYVDSPELGEGFAFRHPRGRSGRHC